MNSYCNRWVFYACSNARISNSWLTSHAISLPYHYHNTIILNNVNVSLEYSYVYRYTLHSALNISIQKKKYKYYRAYIIRLLNPLHRKASNQFFSFKSGIRIHFVLLLLFKSSTCVRNIIIFTFRTSRSDRIINNSVHVHYHYGYAARHVVTIVMNSFSGNTDKSV